MSGLEDSEIIATATKHSSADSFEYPNEELEGYTSCEVCDYFVPTEEIRSVMCNKWEDPLRIARVRACCEQCNPLYSDCEPLSTRILSIFLHEIVVVPIIMIIAFAILYSFV